MRIIALAGLIAVTLTLPGRAAPPVFGGPSQSARVQAPPATSQTGWSSALGDWFGMRTPKPAPTQARVAPHPFAAQQPTTTQRFRQAVTNNPVVAAVRPSNWMPASPTPAQRQDALSLNRPPSGPNAEMLTALAGAAEQAGNVDAARAHLHQALAIEPGSVAALRKLGRLEDRQGRLDEAERHYQQAVASNPGHAGALNDLALCHARQGELQESLQSLEQAIALQPQKPLYRNNLAKVLLALGEQEKAAENLLAVYPPAVAHYNLGQLLASSGKRGEALAQMQQAAAFDPQFQPAAAAIAKLTPGVIPTQVASRPPLPSLPPGAVPQPAQRVGVPVDAATPLPALPGAAASPAYQPATGVAPRLLPPVQ